eukprot:s65_g4.t1
MSAVHHFVLDCQRLRFLAASTINLQSSMVKATGSSASSGSAYATATQICPDMCCSHLRSLHLPKQRWRRFGKLPIRKAFESNGANGSPVVWLEPSCRQYRPP